MDCIKSQKWNENIINDEAHNDKSQIIFDFHKSRQQNFDSFQNYFPISESSEFQF